MRFMSYSVQGEKLQLEVKDKDGNVKVYPIEDHGTSPGYPVMSYATFWDTDEVVVRRIYD